MVRQTPPTTEGVLVTLFESPGFSRGEDVNRELITWWKTANKWSRALNGEPEAEGRAQRGILTEARRRAAGGTGIPDQLWAAVSSVAPNAMVVARRTTDFVAVEPEPRIYGAGSVPQNVFVRIHEFTGAGKFRKTSEWKTLTHGQVAKWSVLKSGDGWDEWNLDVVPRQHLSDTEITAIIDGLRASAVADYGSVTVIKYWENQKKKDRVMAQVYYPSRFINDRWPHESRPVLGALNQPSHQVPIDVGADGSGTVGPSRGWWASDRSWSTKWRAEGADRAESPHLTNSGSGGADAVVWTDEALLAADRELGALWLADVDRETAISERCRARSAQIRAAWDAADVERRHQRFLEDFGDDSLWADHKKTQTAAPFPMKSVYGSNGVLYDLISRLVRAGIDVSGMTVAEAIKLDGGDGAGFPAGIVELRFAAAK